MAYAQDSKNSGGTDAETNDDGFEIQGEDGGSDGSPPVPADATVLIPENDRRRYHLPLGESSIGRCGAHMHNGATHGTAHRAHSVREMEPCSRCPWDEYEAPEEPSVDDTGSANDTAPVPWDTVLDDD